MIINKKLNIKNNIYLILLNILSSTNYKGIKYYYLYELNIIK